MKNCWNRSSPTIPNPPAAIITFSKRSIDSAHTLFSVQYHSAHGITLHKPLFSDHNVILTHPSDYTQTQLLGITMRNAGVDLFEYVSACDTDAGLCAGLFTPTALSQKAPASSHQWFCETRADQVMFKPFSQSTVYRFSGKYDGGW